MLSALFGAKRSVSNDFFEYKHSIPGCKGPRCLCDYTVSGKHEITNGYSQTVKSTVNGRVLDDYEKCRLLMARLAADWDMSPLGIPFRHDSDITSVLLKMGLARSKNMKKVPAPVPRNFFPEPRILPSPTHEVEKAFLDADKMYFASKGLTITPATWKQALKDVPNLKPTEEMMKAGVFDETYSDHDTLQSLCLRRLSHYRMAFGKTNGRPHAVSALANLYPDKAYAAFMSHSRPIVGLPPQTEEIMKYTTEAMAIMDHMLHTSQFIGKCEPKLDAAASIEGMYLGSASGLNIGPENEWKTPTAKLVKSACGKKFEEQVPSINAVKDFITDNIRPQIWWATALKDEIYHSMDKQMNDDDYNAWLNKVRTFMIPSNTYIILERLVSPTRITMERGHSIALGGAWVHGGADHKAKHLGTYDDPFSRWVVEADFRKLDQSVIDKLMELYYANTIKYFKPDSKMLPTIKRIVRLLVEELVQRITSLIGQLWYNLRGGVPSGVFNTSHMDSWIVLFLFCLFGIHMVHEHPAHGEKIMKNMIERLIAMLVYGDDIAYTLPMDADIIAIMNGHSFANWLHRYFGMELRDIKDGIPFITNTKDGWITCAGLSFLKHYFILNPDFGQGKQPKYLPFRETKEIVMRAGWGRTAEPRDLFKVLLSTIGHAYGTYAANIECYNFLKCLYTVIVRTLGIPEIECLANIERKCEKDEIRKFRQMDLTVEDLMAGFPTLSALKKKNEYDASYHKIQNKDRNLYEEYAFDFL